jgi:hypothetical protein
LRAVCPSCEAKEREKDEQKDDGRPTSKTLHFRELYAPRGCGCVRICMSVWTSAALFADVEG